MFLKRFKPCEIDAQKTIREVEKILRGCNFTSNVLSIRTAKVPIVKFKFKDPVIEADISLYNSLALRNTELLLSYARIDPRVRELGYTVKYFAKVGIVSKWLIEMLRRTMY